MMEKMICSKSTIDFLLFSYFGITLEDDDDTVLDAAIRRAYRDAASHVLTLIEEQKKDGNKLKTTAMDIIKNAVKQLSETISYDIWHENLCHVLRGIYTEEVMSYGIAQKWVNMTMKYLYLLHGLIQDFEYGEKVYKLQEQLHVPIDSYIIEAVWKEELTLPVIADKLCKDGRWGKYQAEKVKAWSTWDKNEYDDFRSSLNEKMQFAEDRLPLEWENEAWLKVAKERRGK